MKDCNILLVAVGGIGFRHFQALLNCQSGFALYVVDVNREALERARVYADQQVHNKTVYYLTSVAEIEQNTAFKVAIIATSSLPRKEVFLSVIDHHSVETVIFEKVLFPRLNDYAEVAELLQSHHINAYVNCIRRTAELYELLREQLRNSDCITASARGSNWGLACNSVHMLDLFDFLASTDAKNIICSGAKLEDVLFQSKRNGYVEFFGALTGTIGDRVSFSIECDQGDRPLQIQLDTDTQQYKIDEGCGNVTVLSADGFAQSYHLEDGALLVSQTTTKIVDRILRGESAGLTTFEDSCRLHLPILKEFIKKQNQILGKDEDLCPIT